MSYNVYTYQEENRGVEIIDDKQAASLYVSAISVPVTSFPTTTLIIKSMVGAGPSAAAAANMTLAPAITLQAFATNQTFINFSRQVTGNYTVPMMYFGPQSAASAPWIEFAGSGGPIVSITSIVLTTVANTVAAIRIKYGNSYGWLPVFADAGLVGTGAF